MSLKVLIFEDENLSAEHLVNLIHRYDRTIVPLGVIESVRQGINWLNTHPEPDLLIMDIQLSDGSCFDLFKQVKTECPVIFTTAFNEYAIQAFKVNSIDYLLKPVDFDELQLAFEKFRKQRKAGGTGNELLYQQLYSQLLKDNQYKKRLLIKIGEQLKQVNIDEIAFFLYDTGMSWAVTCLKNRYPLDYSLDELEKFLDPASFFRINRKFIINPGCIEKIHTYFNNRLKLQLRPDPQTEVLVSRERVQEFKNWLDS
jgi:two-component system, LytTR family, response regulator LytT